jgi:hypothetical protein
MPGRYVALYDGEGTLEFAFDAKVWWPMQPQTAAGKTSILEFHSMDLTTIVLRRVSSV